MNQHLVKNELDSEANQLKARTGTGQRKSRVIVLLWHCIIVLLCHCIIVLIVLLCYCIIVLIVLLCYCDSSREEQQVWRSSTTACDGFRFW